MARTQANLQFGAFAGLRGTTPLAKLLYCRILIEDTVNQAGVGALRLGLWARDLEVDESEAAKALAELDEGQWVLVDHDTEQILIRTLIRNDGIASKPNVLWAAVKAAKMLRSPRLRVALAAELRKLPPKPPPTPTRNGRLFEHPDPHATADEIDPPDPGDGGCEPVDSSEGEPFENRSRTVPDAAPSEGFPNRSRTTGGGGGGGGGGSSPVGGHSGSAPRPARDPADDAGLTAVQEMLPAVYGAIAGRPSEPPGCRVHRKLPPDRRPSCKGCQHEREKWEREGRQLAEVGARSRRTAIDACDQCDPWGQIELPDGSVRKCNHLPPPESSVPRGTIAL